MYPSQEIAEDALIEAHTRFDYGKGSGPIAVYQCGDCGHFHFTSQGTMNEKLAALMKDGKLKRMKDVADWENKFKRR
jgi:hypothetical protein